MNKLACTIVISMLINFSFKALAAGADYKCIVERFNAASSDNRKLHDYYEKQYIGKEFTVERRTGHMSGQIKNSYLTEPQVIDYGSTENSYKVVTTMRKEQGAGAGSNIYALTINEFETSDRKPFVFMSNDKVMFGTCITY